MTAPPLTWTADEMMTVAAARALVGRTACFVGIGLPSTAANLARRTAQPRPRPHLRVGHDRRQARPCRRCPSGTVSWPRPPTPSVSVPEIFNYWLQPGRIDVGFLGAAQLDRFGNINTTVIGDDYRRPKVRLPGAGGAPEIAASCREVFLVLRHSRRTFVDRVDFVTSVGFGDGPGPPGAARAARARPGPGHHRPRRARARPGHLRAHADRAAPGRRGRDRAGPRPGWELAVAADARRRPSRRPRRSSTRCAR